MGLLGDMISSIQSVDVHMTPARIVFSNSSIIARERLYVLHSSNSLLPHNLQHRDFEHEYRSLHVLLSSDYLTNS